MAYAVFTVSQKALAVEAGDLPSPPASFVTYTAVLCKDSEKLWKIVHLQAATQNTVSWM